MNIFVLLMAFLLTTSALCFGETIYFKDGRKIQGTIVEKTDQAVKVSVAGVVLTCYPDEIDRIESGSAQKVSTLSPAVSAQGPKEMNLESKAAVVAAPRAVALPASQKPLQMISQTEKSLDGMTKRDLITALMDASGTKENMNKVLNQLLGQASAEGARKIRDIINIDEVLDQIAPIYEKYFSDDELKGLVSFYRSPLGQKLLLATPLIVQDSAEVSRVYFQKKVSAYSQNSAAPKSP